MLFLQKRNVVLLFFLVAGFLGSCRQSEQGSEKVEAVESPTLPPTEQNAATADAESQSGSNQAEPTAIGEAGVDPCPVERQASISVGTIEQAVELINSLPKPLTLPCFLSVLRRPLQIHATKSRISAQPAPSEESPRIFIFMGLLVLSIVPDGPSSTVVEFSYLLSNSRSVKGELPFPVQEQLAPDAAYTYVLRESGTGTRCAACHQDEEPAPEDFLAGAFVSRALRPNERELVAFSSLEAAAEECAGQKDQRCQVMNALFGHGRVLAKDFPETMPKMFD